MLLRARIGILSELGLLLKPFRFLGLDLKMIHIFRHCGCSLHKVRPELWIFVHSPVQFSYKSHSFAVWGIQEMCTKMRACTWLFSVCRTAATWRSSARLLGQGCVPVSWGAGWCWISAVFQWDRMLDAPDPFQTDAPKSVSSAPQCLLLSCPCGASWQQPSSHSLALEAALSSPHTITSSSDCSLRGFSTCSMIQLHCSVLKVPLMIQPLGICSASQCSYNDSKSSL